MKTDFDYLDSLREEISHGYHEANQIVAQAKLNYTYLKAPNGRPTKLRLEDWILARTKAFKEKFGDWETAYKKRYLLYHEAVKQLSGNEFDYLHEVWTEKSLTSVRSNAVQRQPSHLQGTAKVLQDIVCASDLPEIFFDENGEPRLEGSE